MTSAELVLKLCRERKIPLSKMERDLHFSNGYVGKMSKSTKQTFPGDRLKQIADYFNLPLDFIASGGEAKPNFSEKNARLTSRVVADRDLANALEHYFELPKEQREYVIQTIEAMHKMSH